MSPTKKPWESHTSLVCVLFSTLATKPLCDSQTERFINEHTDVYRCFLGAVHTNAVSVYRTEKVI